MAEWKLWLGDFTLTVRSFDHGRIRNVTKIVIDGHTYALNATGEMFSTAVSGNAHYGKLDRRALNIFRVAARFGLLPKETVKELQQVHERRAAVRDASRSACDLERAAKGFNVTLPANVKRRVARAHKALKDTLAA